MNPNIDSGIPNQSGKDEQQYRALPIVGCKEGCQGERVGSMVGRKRERVRAADEQPYSLQSLTGSYPLEVAAQGRRARIGAYDENHGAKDDHPSLATPFAEQVERDERHGHDEVPLLGDDGHELIHEDMPQGAVDQDEGGPVDCFKRVREVIQ